MPRLRDTSGTERYEIGIPEVGMPSPRAQGAGNELSFGSSNAQGVGNLGKAFEGLSLAIRAREDEYDKSKVEYANNEYQRWLLDYTNNPETGLFNARKGYDAIMDNSVLGDFDKESLKMKDSLAKKHKMNKNQLALWNQVAPRTALPYYEQAQNYEQKEYAAFKQQNLETHIANGTEAVLAAPLDPLVFATFKEQLAGYLQVEYGHVSDETFAQMYETQVSAVEQQRIASIAIQDPLGAYAIMEKSKDLTPQDKAALRKTLQEEVDMVKRQQTAAKFFAQYPNDPTAAYAAIRKAHPGSEGEGILQSYGELAGEATATENKIRAETARVQDEAYQNILMETVYAGIPPSLEAIQKGNFSASQRRSLYNMRQGLMTREGVRKALMNDPSVNYFDMTAVQKEQAEMERLGVTQAEREEWNSVLNANIINGTLDKFEIDEAYTNGFITRKEREDKMELLAGMDSAISDMAKREKMEVESTLRALYSNGVLSALMVDDTVKAAMDLYNDKFAEIMLDKDAMKSPELLGELRRSTITSAYSRRREQMGEAYVEPLNENYNAIINAAGYFEPKYVIPEFYIAKEISLPESYPDEIPMELDSNGAPVAVVAPDLSNSPVVAAVEGGRTPGPNADREVAKAGDANSSGSIDVPAKEGAGIQGFDLPFDMTLTESFFSKTGGNMKVYTGTDTQGRKIRMRYLHLQSLDGAPKGSFMTSTQNIGFVGNTGRSHGAHLHFDLTIDGKWYPPSQYLLEVQSGMYDWDLPFGLDMTNTFDAKARLGDLKTRLIGGGSF